MPGSRYWEKLDAAASEKSGYSGYVHTEVLTEAEQEEWLRVVVRMEKIIQAACAGNTGVLVDAEETWIQDPVDALTMQMMQKYNRQKVYVYNTVQLYRSDRLSFLKSSTKQSLDNGFLLGVKLVRGAYMEKERKRAGEQGYSSPIHKNKEATDRDYDAALQWSIVHITTTSVIVATHNEASNRYAAALMQENALGAHHPHVHFSQLYGMSDHITFNLAKAGYSVSKYLPFGPLEEVIPYLIRRAQENSSVAGHTGRELALIRKELKRRGNSE